MSLSSYRESLLKKGLWFCVQEASKRILPLRWVNSRAAMELLFEERAFRYLKRRYQPLLKDYRPTDEPANEPSRVIWVCWLQGEENAPDLVKRCIASMRQHAGGYEVRVVTNENLRSYVTIPDYITHALKKRRMQFATYSDYIRMALLAKHGGIWIDATVLLTAPVPEELLSSPLFVFQNSPVATSPLFGSSWFIVSKANNEIVQQAKYLFECYWQREKKLCHYYLFHMLLTLVFQYNEANVRCLREMPYISNAEVHLLQRELFEPYDAQRFNEICRRAFCHKLTYKTRNKALLQREDTNYQYILKN